MDGEYAAQKAPKHPMAPAPLPHPIYVQQAPKRRQLEAYTKHDYTDTSYVCHFSD